MTVRARAAPAPSGELHVGNVRTFIFNWLFTRHVGGTFILRIEDTDKSRFTEEAFDAALRDLRWIGLDWDEGPETGGGYGPYRQSERVEMHSEAADKLLSSGATYRCYCTAQELEERRRQAMAQKRRPGYDGRCFMLTQKQKAAYEAEGKPFAVRFRVPEQGSLTFDDLVIGRVDVDLSEIDDFVVVRSDGSPLYQLGVVVDDAGMQITHVIRGDDHLSNTPKQILLHEALGNAVPVFAHVPQVFGPDRKPLSKRHGSTSVAEFREKGYLAEALFNYLALLGWGTADDTIMGRRELIDRFEIEHVHASPAMFDPKKLDWMNGEYIRMLSVEDLTQHLIPWFEREGLVGSDHLDPRVPAVASLVQTRVRTLAEAPAYARPVLSDPVIDEAAFEKVMGQPHVRSQLQRSVDLLDQLDGWTRDAVEETLRQVQTEMELKPKTAFAPFYVAVTGSTVGAPIFDVMALIGRQESLRRLREAIARLA